MEGGKRGRYSAGGTEESKLHIDVGPDSGFCPVNSPMQQLIIDTGQ